MSCGGQAEEEVNTERGSCSFWCHVCLETMRVCGDGAQVLCVVTSDQVFMTVTAVLKRSSSSSSMTQIRHISSGRYNYAFARPLKACMVTDSRSAIFLTGILGLACSLHARVHQCTVVNVEDKSISF